MKKFSIVEKTELQMSIEVQSEHEDVYNELKELFDKHGIKIPWTREEFFKKIAKAHLKEIEDYYTRLKKMENE